MKNLFFQTLVNSLVVFTLGLQTAAPWATKTQYTSTNSQLTSSESGSEQQDAFGNLIQDEVNNRFNYYIREDGFFQTRLSSDLTGTETNPIEFNPFDPSLKIEEVAEEIFQTSSPQVEPGYLTEKWRTGIWGTGIGGSGISALDLDNDEKTEIVLGGGYGFGDNRFWYILSFSPESGTYQQEWLSREYTGTINRIVVADYNSDNLYEIYIGLSNGGVEIYNAVTRDLIGTFTSSVGTYGMTVADVDNDGEKEIVVTSSSGIAVYNASTYIIEWQTSSYGSSDIAVGNVDSDEAPEIVTLNRVIDGISHALEWYYSNGFGSILQLADIDGDEMAEIISSKSWYYIYAYDADTKTAKWELTTSLDIQALYVGDIDSDGVQEVVYGDGQWGKIHVYNSITLVQEWNISNPEHGVTGVSFGDVDNDNVPEVLWGAGWSSTGADIFYVGNTTLHTIEWKSKDIGGPLSALDVGDVDNDGAEEIVMVSFTSASGYSDGIIFIYDAQTYALEWQSSPILSGHAWTGVQALQLADIDEDEVLEILIATADYYDGLIIAFDGLTHNLEWQTAKYGGTYFSALEVADIDNDGHVEVIGGQDREHTGATGVYVRVFNGQSGVEKWKTINLTYWGGVFDIEAGDPDGDGNPEILFSVDDGKAYIYDGMTHVQEWQSSFSSPRGVAFMDVDQDGVTEFLVGNTSGTVYAYNGQTFAQEWNKSFTTGSINSLQLTDFDKDGPKELVLSNSNYVYIYDAITRTPIWQSPYLGTSTGNRGHLVIQDIDEDTRSEVVVGSSFAIFVFAYDLLPFDGSISVNQDFAAPGTTLTYTLGLIGFSEAQLPMVITDVIPASTNYITDSMWVSAGSWNLIGDTITWSVALTTSIPVSLTYAVSILPAVPHGTEVVNTAIFDGELFMDTRSASTFVDAEHPNTIITQPISGEIITGDMLLLVGTSADEGAGLERVEINVNESGWQTVTGLSNWVFEWMLPITDAWFTIEARAIDKVGNVEPSAAITNIFVDNLFPHIVSTSPSHGEINIPLTSPIVIEFSEPILPETFEFACSPNPGSWIITTNPDNTVFTLEHAPFNADQLYSCMVISAKDRAMHGLVGGPVANPWAFVTTPPGIEDVVLSGPTTGLVQNPLSFVAEVSPISATLPISYTWEGTGISTVIVSSGISDTFTTTWDEPGTKVITVTASNAFSSASITHTVTLYDAPIIGLTATNDSPTGIGNTTTLTATISEGTNVSFTWDFGDGGFGSGTILTHTYTALGVYTATVTASNTSATVTATTLVTVTEVPIAGLEAKSDSPTTINDTTTLTATISEGTNVSFTWDFGDGEGGSGPTQTHTYLNAGVYTATVIATNSNGTMTATTSVTITNIPITGLTAINNSPIEIGNTATLTATISEGTNVSYAWDFGDGEIGSGAVLTHTYTAPGIYTARVTASNGLGDLTATTVIIVNKLNFTVYLPLIIQIKIENKSSQGNSWDFDSPSFVENEKILYSSTKVIKETDLRGKSIHQRTRALIDIAHPDQRARLEEEAIRLKFL